MTDLGTHVSERAKFAAREFVAKYERELGVRFPNEVLVHLVFAFEIGFSRGFSTGVDHAVAAFTARKATT